MNNIKITLTLLICMCSLSISYSQIVTTEPVFPNGEEEITIIFDATLAEDSRAASLLGLTDGVFLWSGAGSTDQGDAFQFQPSGQTNFGAAFEPGRMTSLGDDRWSITITPRTFYGVPEGTPIERLGMVFKNTNGSAQTEDIFVDLILPGTFALSLSSPELPAFFDEAEDFNITLNSSEEADFSIEIDDQLVFSATGVTSVDETFTATGAGSHTVNISATANDATEEINFSYFVRSTVVEESIPEGLLKGINYHDDDDTKATLVLLAPQKSSVFVIGDFNDWEVSDTYLMKKDGDLFWLEVTGLTPNQEYAFQYLVDESIYIADPYTDKILHPEDQFISDEIYPNLKSYPQAAFNSNGIYRTVAVLETNQTEYQWENTDYVRPNQSELVIYELLIRDFFNNGQETYANLTDTLSYLKSLGVNAIELMPITEFAGNDSWGYNPTFMFAPDKAYGPKNELKKFIDTAHGLGMAVILDNVINHQDQPMPYVIMYFNNNSFQVTEDNPMFNVTAKHPFNVFYDMNHESQMTQDWADSVNHYWLNEYKFDGYRFDLSKGFTQVDYGEDVGAWSSFDQSRIDLLERMADAIWEHSPDAYVMLEHFASNTEETVLANYGMMSWGNLHGAFRDNILGIDGGGDISSLYHGTRGWDNANLIGYMESHDEQRQVYDALNDQSSNVSDLDEALERVATASAMLYLVPGPKMLWQFGEFGYDIDIDQNGRTGQKPNPWNNTEGLNYNNEANRVALRHAKSAILDLKTRYSVFNTGTASFSGNNSLKKQITLLNAANTTTPTSADEMNAVLIFNFETESQNMSVDFPHESTWYDYFADEEFSGLTTTVEAGGFKLLTDFNLGSATEPPLSIDGDFSNSKLLVYPNPSADRVTVSGTDSDPLYYFVIGLDGREVLRGKLKDQEDTIDLSKVSSGTFVLEVITRAGTRYMNKIIRK